jgi:hypothetical protein
MTDQEKRDLRKTMWKHIGAEEFAQAEVAARRLIETTAPDDALESWNLHGVLASILNSLERPREGTEMYAKALQEARRSGQSKEIDVARYMLANQHLVYGDPSVALSECSPIPPGVGHVECLLHAVAAGALWELDRRDEALRAARRAVEASPTTDERRAALSEQLGYILGAG